MFNPNLKPMKDILKDRTNQEILRLLEKNDEMSLGNIVKNLRISAEKGLKHMIRLRQNGLVRIERESKYALNI
jgi:predicted ArsR family transcriptional regulator